MKTLANLVRASFYFNRGGKLHPVTCFGTRGHYAQHVLVGGAIVLTSSNINITGSRFEGNSAGVGGVIFSELHSNITIIILNTTLEGNHDLKVHGNCNFGSGILYIESAL